MREPDPPTQATARTAPPVETFWPDASPEALQRWRAQQGLLSLLAGLGGGAVLAVLVLFQLASSPRLAEDLVEIALTLPFLGLCGMFLYFGIPAWELRRAIRRSELARDGCAPALDPGEVLRAVCPAISLGLGRGGYLLLTDRRALWFERQKREVAWAELGRLSELRATRITRATGRLGWHWRVHFGEDQALGLRAGAGLEHRLMIPGLFVDRLCVVLKALGLELGFRNDDDLPSEPAAAPQLRTAALADPGA